MEPPVRQARTVSLPVLLGGLASTALTLALVYGLGEAYGFNAMGLYGYYVLPFGAFVVGLLAGSGYGIASKVTGFRIGRATLWVVLGLQVAAYALAKYLEYRMIAAQGGALPAFLPYLDEAARSIRFENDNGSVGQPLGALGYGVLLLELAGFAGGALLVPAALRSSPYCDACGRYMKTRAIGVLPAAVPERRMWRKADDEKAAYAAEQETARVQGMAVHDHLFGLARAGDGPAFAEASRLVAAGTKEAGKLPTRLPVSLASCPACRRGVLSSQVMTGAGNQTATTALDSADVSPALVRSLDA